MLHSHLNDMEIPETKRYIPKGFALGTTQVFFSSLPIQNEKQSWRAVHKTLAENIAWSRKTILIAQSSLHKCSFLKNSNGKIEKLSLQARRKCLPTMRKSPKAR